MNAIQCRTPMMAAQLTAAIADVALIVGDSERMIRSIASLDALCSGALSFSKSSLAEIPGDWPQGVVVIVPITRSLAADANFSSATLIEVEQPRAYFIRALHVLACGEQLPVGGRSASAWVAGDARIGADVHIGPNVVVGSRAVIGDGSVLYGGAHIYDDVEIGVGCIVQANAVIGCHGQAYVRDEAGKMLSMPHFGSVRIGDRCRIGAGASIVRGTLRDTVIGNDSSIGNMTNIGHNVEIGERCFVGPGTLLAGSSTVGSDTWVSIGAIVRGTAIGRNAMVGAGAVVTRPVSDGQTVNGFPARVTAAQS